MSIYLELNPAKPDPRDLAMLADAIKAGALVAYPTCSGYALGCAMGAKKALDRIKDLRQLESKHNYSLICRDLAHISEYARVDNPTYRILKRCTPGPYTFILPASNNVPKLLKSKSKKTIGIRVPEYPIPHAIAEALGESFVTSSLILPGDDLPLVYADDVSERIGDAVDYIVDGGYCGHDPTTVIDLSGPQPVVLREGLGDCSWLK